MISLEQVRALEARVEKAVAFIASLRAENAALKDGLLEAELRTEAAEARTAELEDLIKEFQKDQERIEEGIVQALHKLDAFEDVVHAAAKAPSVSTPTTVADQEAAPAQARVITSEPVAAVSVVGNTADVADQVLVQADTGPAVETATGDETEDAATAASLTAVKEADGSGSDQSDGLDIF